MPVTESALLDALKTVIDPNTGRDFVSTKQLKNLRIDDGDVAFDVELGYPAKSQLPMLRKALIAAAKSVAGVEKGRFGDGHGSSRQRDKPRSTSGLQGRRQSSPGALAWVQA